jgi:hypothetical protein
MLDHEYRYVLVVSLVLGSDFWRALHEMCKLYGEDCVKFFSHTERFTDSNQTVDVGFRTKNYRLIFETLCARGIEDSYELEEHS